MTDPAALPPIGPAEDAEWPAIVTFLAGTGLPIEDLGSTAVAFHVARDAQGRVVGTVGLEGGGGERLIRSLAVAPALRGHGLGSALLATAEARARADGVTRLYLLTLSPGFFATRGYAAVARADVPPAVAHSAEFTRLCPDAAACLTRELAADAEDGA